MFSKFLTHIEKDFSFLKNSRLLVAVSGGLDSMVLLLLLKQWNADIAVAHCNFGLRGSESDGDEAFVALYCQNNSIPFFNKQFDTQLPKHSTQMAARTLRYEWFESLLDKHSFDFLLTAHHADDNLETLLINLTRGAGVAGLSGIPPINNRVVRPLLPFSKKEILDFAQKNNLDWREDSSNQKLDYLRNQIRHQVVPALKNIQPQLLDQVQKSIQFLNDTNEIQLQYFDSLIQQISTQDKFSIRFSIEKIKQLHHLETHLFELFSPYGFASSKELLKFLKAPTGKEIQSSTHRLISDRGEIVLTQLIYPSSDFYEVTENEIQHPIRLSTEEHIGNFQNTPCQVFIDKSSLQFPLLLRKKQSGDYFFPLGMMGKKKISKFFNDEKMSILAKESQWLLCSGDAVVWVVGKRLDSRFVASTDTLKPLKITYYED